jgi:putative endonuclease
MSARAHVHGRLGEELALRHLLRKGWTLLDRNVRDGPREVDLVLRRGDMVAFVEVKTRAWDSMGHPLEGLSRRQRARIRRAARRWLQSHPQPGVELRFDAVTVRLGPGPEFTLEHWEDAWGLWDW